MALILREGPTFGINGNFGASEKKTDINFSKALLNKVLFEFTL